MQKVACNLGVLEDLTFIDLIGRSTDSTAVKTNRGFARCAAKKITPSQLLNRREQSRLFCHTAKRFLLNLPGATPSIALLLDVENIVLDHVIWPNDDRSETSRQVDIFECGTEFSPAALVDEIPLYSQAPATVLPEIVSMNGVRWYGVATSIERNPQSICDNHRIAFLSAGSTALDALANSITICAHAINHHLTSSQADEAARANRDEAISILSPYDKKLLDYEKNSSLAALCAGIAHEIRNPLTAARGFLQLFEAHCRKDDLPFLELTINELDRIGQLVQDFMQVARPCDEESRETDLCGLTYSVCQFLLPEANLFDVELNCNMPSGPVQLNVQVDRIKQVLINLLQNAVHACTNRGNVNICIEDSEDCVYITVIDNGCGISDTDQLFRPFHTTKPNGTGLGMFVSKHIVEQHHGNIYVDSEVGQGTTLIIRLPRLP